ncbi:MAG: TIGR00730 family Rossman fold protein [Armatimonadetes bacterium]|nr:TIGR00730 family Rossman fold protein [Armatimonadota bacterium]
MTQNDFALRRVAVFCGSAMGNDPAHRDAAEAFAALLAANGIGIVYGGAASGLMGAVADTALSAGGEVIGVLPYSMAAREIAHRDLTALHLVETLHERKAKMAELADAFVALPGGIGTLEEIFEVLSWAQIGLHQKPVALLNTNGFYEGLLAFLQTTATTGFVRAESLALLLVEPEPEPLLQKLRAYAPPAYDRWTTP